MSDDLFHRSTFFINGRFEDPSTSETIAIVSPSTEEVVGSVPDASTADIDRAVAAANDAAKDPKGWAHWTASERADAIDRLADAFAPHQDEENAIRVDELGMPVSGFVKGGPSRSAELLKMYAQTARDTDFDYDRKGMYFPGRMRIRRRPFGVTAAISPFNGSLFMGLFKAAPTLAAGGTVVMKPPPEAPLEAYLLAQAAIESGFPPGVLNIIPGGREAGAHLVAHPDVANVGFTGSTAGGRAIGEVCGKLLKPVTLELGGKSAAILLDDFDLEKFVPALAFLAFAYSGQQCFSNSRVLVPRSRYEETADAIVEFISKRVIGVASDPATQMGPVINAAARDRIESYFATGVGEGATIATGGKRPAGFDKGFFLEPTVFTNVTNDMRVAREEIFGPIVALIAYDGDDEAVSIANDTEFGLAGTVWSKDVARAEAVAEQIDTGSIGINGYTIDPSAPLSGWKQSGLGFEMSPEAMSRYLQYQTVYYAG